MAEPSAGYKPGDIPLEETDDRRLFCKFYYKGVLSILVPILLAPILLGQPVVAFRFIYITVCLYIFYIFDLMPRGGVAFAYVVFAPIAGIANSGKICVSYYTDLLLMVYGCTFLAIMMQASRLSEHLGFIVIRFVGSSIIKLQLFLAAGVFLFAFFANPTAAVAVWMAVTQAVLTEYDNGGVLKINSEEKLYEPGGREYPTLPVVGIYLTLCYTATLAGSLSPIVNPNGEIVDAFNGKLKIEHMTMIMVVPVVLGVCVMILWIQVVFLGLLGGSIKRELMEMSANKDGFQESVKARKTALGPWKIHAILALTMILIALILMHTRKPRIYQGWDDISPKITSGYSVPSLGLIVFFTAIPANYFFCRYYVCREPDKQGTAPSLIGWKVISKNTPWGDILMLAATFCCVYCAKESDFLKVVANSIQDPHGGFLHFLSGAAYGTLFTIFCPATTLAKMALPVMIGAGRIFALPFATALNNQFLLPTSSPGNTIVSGMGNVRPFLFLLGGIVPTIFMMIIITASTWIWYPTLPK